jgi:hypothetical protein
MICGRRTPQSVQNLPHLLYVYGRGTGSGYINSFGLSSLMPSQLYKASSAISRQAGDPARIYFKLFTRASYVFARRCLPLPKDFRNHLPSSRARHQVYLTLFLLQNPSIMVHARYHAFKRVRDMQRSTWYSKPHIFYQCAEGQHLLYMEL